MLRRILDTSASKLGTSGIVSSHGMIGSVSEARVIDVVLHLMCAQGRVVRQEARTRYTVEVDGIESEADRSNQYSVSWSMKGTAQSFQSKT